MRRLLGIMLVGFLLIQSTKSSAQVVNNYYDKAIGAKFYPNAITFKKFVTEENALEGVFYISDFGFRVTALFENHQPVDGYENLFWYVGLGTHIGYGFGKYNSSYPDSQEKTYFGADAVIGLDYKIKFMPINLSIDWQPSLNFLGNRRFEAGWGGVSIRYIF